LFATGLSSDGRLTSAVHTTAFYGQPLVSWTPALGAEVYEVQWSKTQYPFTPQATSTGTLGIMTSATSVVLPVTPGSTTDVAEVMIPSVPVEVACGVNGYWVLLHCTS